MLSNQSPFATLIGNHLRVGAVLHKHCDFTTPPKDKFLVVASLEPRLLVLLINSQINQFYVQQGLDHLHVPVPEAEHNFLTHDSYTNCVEAHTAFDCSQIRQEVIDNYANVFKGWLTDECLEAVYHAVKGNNIIRRGYQKEIIAAIESQLPHLHTAF
ncbi:hypothetical protein [Pseudoalteromonas gelatinilytica]|uniref:Uncharacterized protein n=1 Tax=Pseudoalteromonas gelatinilytica TaxID=1703256 RepID=A0ABQ1U382_9GAMM|nr:hypothetical protein [Pseudoalteromonas profundi]GGF07414.1 hypothetical protein GCM10008027_35390 [Pseudoalteromonas profundi]